MITRSNAGWVSFAVLLAFVFGALVWDTSPMTELRRQVTYAVGPADTIVPKLRGRMMTRLEASSRSWASRSPETYTIIDPPAGSLGSSGYDDRPMPKLPSVLSDNYSSYAAPGTVSTLRSSNIHVWIGDDEAKPMFKEKHVRIKKWVRAHKGRMVKVTVRKKKLVRVMAVEVEPLHAATHYR